MMKAADEDASPDNLTEQVFAIVRAIPAGEVLSYGGVGARCNPPISGYICGRLIRDVPADVPWWRVVGKDGNLPVRKRNPELSLDQRSRLEAEGVGFDEGGWVRMKEYSAP